MYQFEVGPSPLFVRPFVCLFVHSIFMLKFLVKLDVSEADVLSFWNFTHITINILLFKKMYQFEVVTLCLSVRLSVCLSIPFSGLSFWLSYFLVKLMSYHDETSHKWLSTYDCLKKCVKLGFWPSVCSVHLSVLPFNSQVKVFGQASLKSS